MPDFTNKVSYINTAGNEIELDKTTAVTTVDENTLSVSHADTADTADLAIVANSATNIKNKAGSNVPLASALLDMVYPIGSIYMSVRNVSPQSFLGGTWVPWGSGRVPVGVDTSQSEFSTSEKTGGEKTHQLTNSEMPRHIHAASPKTGSGRRSAPGSNDGVMFVRNGAIEATQYFQVDTQSPPYGNFLSLNITVSASGNDEPHNNLQPYITCYMWKRTA